MAEDGAEANTRDKAGAILGGPSKPGIVNFQSFEHVEDRVQAIREAHAAGFGGRSTAASSDITTQELHALAAKTPAQLMQLSSARSVGIGSSDAKVAPAEAGVAAGGVRRGGGQHTSMSQPMMYGGALLQASGGDGFDSTAGAAGQLGGSTANVAHSSTGSGHGPPKHLGSTERAPAERAANRMSSGHRSTSSRFRVAVAVEDKPGLLVADAEGDVADTGSETEILLAGAGPMGAGHEAGDSLLFSGGFRQKRASVGSVGAEAMARGIAEGGDLESVEQQAVDAAMALRSHRKAEKAASRRFLLAAAAKSSDPSAVKEDGGAGGSLAKTGEGGITGPGVSSVDGAGAQTKKSLGSMQARSRLKMATKRVQDANRITKVVPPLKPGCLLNKNSSLMRFWDVAMIVLLLYTALLTPYEVSFINSVMFDSWFWVNRVVDIGFLIDLVFNFFLPYRDPESRREVFNHRAIAINYCQGWFVLDLLSIFPFDIVFEAGGGSEDNASRLRIVKVIRLLKLAKLLRVVRASRIVTRWRTRVGLSFSVVQLTSFLVYVLLLAHWSACAFYLVGTLTYTDDGSVTSWVITEGVLDRPYEAYVASIYFSTMTTTTIGYGDIAPQNAVERLFTVFLMILGGGLYAYVIGAIGSIVATFDGATSEHRENMDQLNRYTTELDLPQNLREELREYFAQTLSVQRERYYSHLLGFMSPKLRGHVAMHRHGEWISHVPFFNVGNSHERLAFVTAIAMELQPAVFGKLERVMYAGQTINRMFIIQKGLATVQGRIVSRGHFFGEEAILTQARAISTVRALTYLDVFFLTKESLLQILDSGDFGETRKKIRYAVIRMALRRELLKCAALARIQNGLFRIANGGMLAYAPDPTADVALDQHSDPGSESASKALPSPSGAGGTDEKPDGNGNVGRPPSPPPPQLLELARVATAHRSRRSSLEARDLADDASLNAMVTHVDDHGSLTTGRRSDTSNSRDSRPLSRQQGAEFQDSLQSPASAKAGGSAFPTVVGGKKTAPAFFMAANMQDTLGGHPATETSGFERSPSAQASSKDVVDETEIAEPLKIGKAQAGASLDRPAVEAATTGGEIGVGQSSVFVDATSVEGSSRQDSPGQKTADPQSSTAAKDGRAAPTVLPGSDGSNGGVSAGKSPVPASGQKLRVSRSGRALTVEQRQALARDAKRMSRRMPALARHMSRAALIKANTMPPKALPLSPPPTSAPGSGGGDGDRPVSRGWGQRASAPTAGLSGEEAGAAGFLGLSDADASASASASAGGGNSGYDRGLMQRILNKATQSTTATKESNVQILDLAGQVKSLERVVDQSLASVRLTQYISAGALLLSIVVLIMIASRPTV